MSENTNEVPENIEKVLASFREMDCYAPFLEERMVELLKKHNYDFKTALEALSNELQAKSIELVEQMCERRPKSQTQSSVLENTSNDGIDR